MTIGKGENDGLEEFFIKNLETIQGDERDVMFISTLYGPEKPGERVLQRFGPINSVHGHRRLNVLFTRAKRKMVTFTSLKPTDIIVNDTKHSGVKMLRDWLEYCQTKNIPSHQQGGEETESPFEDYVARQIEALGCSVTPQVGVAGFRIDLGVRHPDWPYGFILGVECDGATYHSPKSSRDRDRLRQEVLEGLGWRLYRIWSTDWFRNPNNEVKALQDAINKSLSEAKKNIVQRNEVSPEEIMHDGSDSFSMEVVPKEPDENSHDIHNTDTINYTANEFDIVSDPTVSLGSRVRVKNLTDGTLLEFTLVDRPNDPDQGRVNIHTPLGRALLDTQVGDEVEFLVGSIIKKAKLLEIY